MRAIHARPRRRVDRRGDATVGSCYVTEQEGDVRVPEVLVDDVGPVHDEAAVRVAVRSMRRAHQVSCYQKQDLINCSCSLERAFLFVLFC